jgi:hypothetical protein
MLQLVSSIGKNNIDDYTPNSMVVPHGTHMLLDSCLMIIANHNPVNIPLMNRP